jgi:uncharacterized membrane protein HdeD (DUF308 family)
MSTTQPDFAAAQRAVADAMRDHWGLFLAEGIILVLLGLLAIVVPPLATLAVTILVGWLFLISGIVGLVTTFWAKGAPGFWWSLVSAIIGIVAGVILLAWPISGTVSLTLVLIVFFIMEGVASIMYGVDHRKEASSRSGWIIASGVIDLILAAIIFSGLPGSAAWAIGLLVGINMVFGGTSMIAMALAARGGITGSSPTTPTPPPTTPTTAAHA